MEKKRRTIWQVAICVGLLCLIWGGYFIVRGKIDRQLLIYEDDFTWVYQVDEIYTQGEKLVLEGFAFELGNDAEEDSFEIVLQNVESKEYHFSKTEGVKRGDVNSYFLCEYDYTNSGFVASIKTKKLLLEENKYEVLIHLNESRSAYRTGMYIVDGKLMHTEDEEDILLDVIGTELEVVIADGVLRLSLPELGFYAYQYNGHMYYIMEEKYKKQEEYLHRVVMTLFTTQINQLPQERVELGAKNDEINAYFDDVNKCGKYYVCVVELPTSYSIIKVNVGNYNNHHWVWKETIRPYYEFE